MGVQVPPPTQASDQLLWPTASWERTPSRHAPSVRYQVSYHKGGQARQSSADLEITLEDSLLTIQGERHVTNDASEQHHHIERRYGAFRHSITLPAHVMADAVEASIEDGVLETLVPKGQ